MHSRESKLIRNKPMQKFTKSQLINDNVLDFMFTGLSISSTFSREDETLAIG